MVSDNIDTEAGKLINRSGLVNDALSVLIISTLYRYYDTDTFNTNPGLLLTGSRNECTPQDFPCPRAVSNQTRTHCYRRIETADTLQQ